MSKGTRVALLGLVVVIAVAAFVIAKPGGDDTGSKGNGNGGAAQTGAKPRALSTRIEVRGGKPVGGVRKIDVKKGNRVRLVVASDVADEIHVHGYDFMKDVPAGGVVRFDFPATIDGAFVIELEKRGEQIAELKVEP
jgi:hypothetical protein